MDREKLEETQKAIEALARGFNPFTGEDIDDNDVLNDVRVVRVLFSASMALQEMLGQEKAPRKNKEPQLRFSYDEDKHGRIIISESPISLSQIVRNIQASYGEECALTYKDIIPYLCQKGLLVPNTITETPKYCATPEAGEYGIRTEKRQNSRGEDYMATLYDSDGQILVLDILKEAKTIYKQTAGKETGNRTEAPTV